MLRHCEVKGLIDFIQKPGKAESASLSVSYDYDTAKFLATSFFRFSL